MADIFVIYFKMVEYFAVNIYKFQPKSY